ncbi:MAG: GldG family protein [Myxococcota bacterium]
MAALLAGLGLVALGFGILTALLAILQPFSDPIWIVGNLVAGVVLLAAAVFMSVDTLRERVRSGATRRAGRYGSSAVFGAVFGVAILGLLAFLSVRHSHRFDVSEAGVHTLSQQTKELIAGLESDVQITAFFAASEAPPVRDLLERYAYEGRASGRDRIELAFVDPNEAPGMVEELGLGTDDLARGVVRISLASGEATNLSEFSESAITNALLKLAKSKDKKIYFLSGHNERPIDPGPNDRPESLPGQPPAPASPFATDPDSFGRAADALVNETYRVESLLLATRGDVPEDAAALVVAGPTRTFLDAEFAALARYVERGGALFVGIDPRAQTNLYDLLGSYGIRLGDDVVVDRTLAIFGQATTPFGDFYDPEHPITRVLGNPSVFPMVRSVEVEPEAAPRFSVLVRTGQESWAERDLDAWRESGRAEYSENDLLGPVPVAVAGTIPASGTPDGDASGDGSRDANADPAAGEGAAPKAGRIVVFGDSDFAANQYLGTAGNRDLFVNAVNWLAGEVESISLRPNVSRASSFQMSQDQFRFLQYVSLLVVPEAIALVGVLVWWTRRHAKAS